MTRKANWTLVALSLAIVLFGTSCSNEFTRSSVPVALIVTNDQQIFRIDLADDVGCARDIATINIESRIKDINNNVDQRFNDVRLTRYRVSYRRFDGGTQVPAPYVRPIDVLVSAGGFANFTRFIVFQSEALKQAPFASLLPQNGGRDPETGRRTVQLEVVLEVFGQTLAGENVSGVTSFPLDFCIDCGGCA